MNTLFATKHDITVKITKNSDTLDNIIIHHSVKVKKKNNN